MRITAVSRRAQVVQQVEDLGLDGYIQRGCWLIGNHDPRLARQRHCDHRALAHAAGELVRKLAGALFGLGDTDQAQHLDRALTRLPAWALLVTTHGFRNLIADRENRVQRGHGLLKYHCDISAADIAHGGFGQRQEVPLVQSGGARNEPAWWARHQPQDRHSGNALATAGFADDGERFARVNLEGDVVDRASDTVRHVELNGQV